MICKNPTHKKIALPTQTAQAIMRKKMTAIDLKLIMSCQFIFILKKNRFPYLAVNIFYTYFLLPPFTSDLWQSSGRILYSHFYLLV